MKNHSPLFCRSYVCSLYRRAAWIRDRSSSFRLPIGRRAHRCTARLQVRTANLYVITIIIGQIYRQINDDANHGHRIKDRFSATNIIFMQNSDRKAGSNSKVSKFK